MVREIPISSDRSSIKDMKIFRGKSKKKDTDKQFQEAIEQGLQVLEALKQTTGKLQHLSQIDLKDLTKLDGFTTTTKTWIDNHSSEVTGQELSICITADNTSKITVNAFNITALNDLYQEVLNTSKNFRRAKNFYKSDTSEKAQEFRDAVESYLRHAQLYVKDQIFPGDSDNFKGPSREKPSQETSSLSSSDEPINHWKVFESINGNLQGLEAEFQSRPLGESGKRSQEKQLREATQRIITNSCELGDIFRGYPAASSLDLRAGREIEFLVKLAHDHCGKGKGYRDKAKRANDHKESDKRSTKEIEGELTLYLEIDHTLSQWKKFTNGEGERPSLAKILALVREQTDREVKAVDDRLKGDHSLAFYEIPTAQQSSEENAIRDALKSLNELRPRLDKARRATESGDLNSVIDYRGLVREYESLYKNSVGKTERGQNSYMTKQKRMERIQAYANQVTGGEVLSSLQASRLSPTFQKEFYYEVVNRICVADDGPRPITREVILAKMKTDEGFVVPMKTGPIEPDDMIKVPLGLGTVKPIFDKQNNAVVNKTEPGHIFHPGCVVRLPVQRGKELCMLTIAFGYAHSTVSSPEKLLARHVLWKRCDNALGEALLKDQKGSPSS